MRFASGDKEDFYDWEYAQKVWFEMNTWDAEEKEWAKYSADFAPWFAQFNKNMKKAKEALKAYPEDKRRNIERAHDIQMVWEKWNQSYYSPWFRDYSLTIRHVSGWHPDLDELKPFAKYIEELNAHLRVAKPNPCIPKRFIDECGPVPIDWRSPQMLQQERELEARLKELQKGRP